MKEQLCLLPTEVEVLLRVAATASRYMKSCAIKNSSPAYTVLPNLVKTKSLITYEPNFWYQTSSTYQALFKITIIYPLS